MVPVVRLDDCKVGDRVVLRAAGQPETDALEDPRLHAVETCGAECQCERGQCVGVWAVQERGGRDGAADDLEAAVRQPGGDPVGAVPQ
ncbi:hypothetical protein GCM10010498_57380 [Streptomyces cavourensis]|nr:hypothetical protein GCM10010498_57380 [Streptomyces cavourensis]